MGYLVRGIANFLYCLGLLSVTVTAAALLFVAGIFTGVAIDYLFEHADPVYLLMFFVGYPFLALYAYHFCDPYRGPLKMSFTWPRYTVAYIALWLWATHSTPLYLGIFK
jgi:hypothetical protein